MFASLRKAAPAIPVFLFAAVSFAQTSNVTGTVKDKDGKPIQNAQIKLDRTDIKASYNVKTNKDGKFLYANLPTGTYNITLLPDGKTSAGQLTGIRLRPGDNPPFDFDLSKVQPAAAAAPPEEQQKGMTPQERAEYEKKLKEQEAAMAKDKALQDAFNAGMEAKNAKNWPVAIENLEKASELGPMQHVVWAQLAEAYLSRSDAETGEQKQTDIDKSVAAYAKAVEIKVDDANYHNNYALALGKGKKFEQAQSELTKAAQLDPPNAGKYYYNLGAMYVNTNQNDPAEAAFKKATELDPTYADAFYQYGIVLIAKAQVDKDGKMTAPAGTAEAFQKYLQLKPDGPNAEGAKALLESMGSKVDTTFERPGAKKQTKGKK